jgi:hypothetical protein
MLVASSEEARDCVRDDPTCTSFQIVKLGPVAKWRLPCERWRTKVRRYKFQSYVNGTRLKSRRPLQMQR